MMSTDLSFMVSMVYTHISFMDSFLKETLLDAGRVTA